MAVEPGRGRTAVPTRTTIMSTLARGHGRRRGRRHRASLEHLVSTPRLFGWNWDLQVAVAKLDAAVNDRVHREIAALLDRSPAVHAWSTITLSDLRLARGYGADGRHRPDRTGPADDRSVPMLVSGRFPQRVDEIALGARSLRHGRGCRERRSPSARNDGRTRRLESSAASCSPVSARIRAPTRPPSGKVQSSRSTRSTASVPTSTVATSSSSSRLSLLPGRGGTVTDRMAAMTDVDEHGDETFDARTCGAPPTSAATSRSGARPCTSRRALAVLAPRASCMRW